MIKHLPKAFFALYVLLVFCSQNAIADKVKWGQVSLVELKMTTYEQDPDAAAVVLYDHGYSYMQYEQNSGFQLVFERHRRVKILKKAGYDHATHAVALYHNNTSSKEKISNLKGFTYNLEDGKVAKTKLNSDDIFTEKVNDNWDNKKFTMPNVKEGSVIEYSYVVISDFYSHLREWEFQEDIPVVWSEYKVKMYEYFNFKPMMQGYFPFVSTPRTKQSEKIYLRYQGGYENNRSHTRVPGGTEQIDVDVYHYHWLAQHVPALREEPYVTTMDDYTTKISFDLSDVKMPNAPVKPYSQTWASLDKTLMGSENFGEQLNKGGFLKSKIAEIAAIHTDPVFKMQAIHSHIKSKMQWDGRYRLYSTNTLRKAYESGTGSSADINLLLIAALKEAGLEADPVILSTRSNGRVMSMFAQLSKFNYVVAHVAIDGKAYLLDATDPFNIPNMLPYHCLNGEGRLLLSNSESRWVPLASPERFVELYSVNVQVNASGQLEGKVTTSASGYAAHNKRREMYKEGKEQYLEKFRKNLLSWDVSSLDVSNQEELSKPISFTYDVVSTEPAIAGDMIYLNPFIFSRMKENPFKLEDRQFPVDYGMAQENTYIMNFKIPNGYKVEDLPKNTIVDLPEQGGRFSYMIAVQGDNIQLSSRMSLRKPLYFAEEYDSLKEFYGHVVAKQAEQIVLKKIN
jgi:hypothetical protein